VTDQLWLAFAIVAEVAARYATMAGAGLRIEMITADRSAIVRFEDVKQRHWEIDLDAYAGDPSAFRGLVEVEILELRNRRTP